MIDVNFMQKKATSKKEAQEKIIDRISRIEGQLKGIRRMVEGNKECMDIITQILAIREAASMLGIELLKNDFICNMKGKEIDEAYLRTLFKMK